jgi:uncharacterized protein (DUF302 family)
VQQVCLADTGLAGHEQCSAISPGRSEEREDTAQLRITPDQLTDPALVASPFVALRHFDAIHWRYPVKVDLCVRASMQPGRWRGKSGASATFESFDPRRRTPPEPRMAHSPCSRIPMPSEGSGKGNDWEPLSEFAAAAVVTKLSPWSMADTLARLSAVVAARGMEMFAVIDHSGNARDVGLDLRDTKLVIFGSPSAITPLLEAAPLAALDLPLRVVVWEHGYQTLVSYPVPAAVAHRYGLDGDLANALAGIDALISAVIAR